ncbi:MAG TPA: zinc-binding dehydrogenase [Alphaproteobacteria bacterium]|nr:zinc-binding dehydrogenase [Alphaproteobacteria bacterium]
MRAVYIQSHGESDSAILGERPDAPAPGPGEMRVRIAYAGFNHVDLYMRADGRGFPHELPMVLGVDGAGIVEAVGDGVETVAAGDRVALYPARYCEVCEFCLRGDQMLCLDFKCIGENIDGTMAEAITVKANQAHRLPDHVPLRDGCVMGTAYITAWAMVMTAGSVRSSDTVLIHGVGGGASLAALQFARIHGARVIVTSSSDAKLEKAIEMGAEAGINYRHEDVYKRVMALTDRRGCDVVIDNVGEATWATSMRCVIRGGRIVCCGATTGPMPGAHLQHLFFRQIHVVGVSIGNQQEFADMLSALDRGLFAPVIEESYAMDGALDALARLDRGEQFGKMVLEIGGQG